MNFTARITRFQPLTALPSVGERALSVLRLLLPCRGS
jgi:hypothetical protein